MFSRRFVAMNLHRLYGHGAIRSRLDRSIRSGRFPQALLLTGPRRVGKQRMALWIAQALLCERQETPACGECHACRQVAGLSHPDLHWFVPLVPSRKSADPDKQLQEVEEALAEVMAERRENPLYGPPDGKASHALASVRLIHRRVSLRPFQGRRKVLIIGDLDRLVVQDASQEAANALLKVLEEPPAETVIIGTTGAPQALLPTIRSRLVPVRMGVVDDDEVAHFLEEVAGLSGRAVREATQLAQGCPGRAVEGGAGDRTGIRKADDLLGAVKRGAAAWAERALAQNPWDARGGFTDLLDTVAVRLRLSLERAAATDDDADVERLLKAVDVVERHRTIAQGNVNPQLGMAVMAGELERLR